MTKKVISLRMDTNELAKARDGLISQGIPVSNLTNVSQIIRLAFYYGLTSICTEPEALPSKESTNFINQRIGQTKTTGTMSLADIIKKD